MEDNKIQFLILEAKLVSTLLCQQSFYSLHTMSESNDPICLAIVGSRQFSDYEFMEKCLEEFRLSFGNPHSIISGDARGADSLAKRWAEQNKIPITVLKTDWTKGKHMGFETNRRIVEKATHLIAFPTASSIGTHHSIQLANEKGIPTVVKTR